MFDDLLGDSSNAKRSRGDGSTAAIKIWAKKHWNLPEDTTLLVSELQCGEADCADIETVIAVLSIDGADKTVKLSKPIYAISEADIQAISIRR